MENANRIRERRKELGLSGPEVANKLGISTQYLYDIERSKRGLNAEILSKLSEILQSTTDYLLLKTDTNLYGTNKENSDSFMKSESELTISVDKLNKYKLDYKGTILSKEDADYVTGLLEAALNRLNLKK